MRSKISVMRRHLGRPSGILIAFALATVTVGAALALQQGFVRKTAATKTRDNSKPVSYRNIVTLGTAGQPVVLDRQTGAVRPLAQDEKARFAQGLRQVINTSSDGLVEVRHEDGSVSM